MAILYMDNPGAGMSGMSVIPGMPSFPNITAWMGMVARFDAQGLRVDQLTALNSATIPPSMRALNTASPNQYQAARLVPRESSVFLDQSHMDLIWQAMRELLGSNPDGADMFGEMDLMFRQSTGLNLNQDVFGWMTGELAFFLSPGGPEAPAGFGGGLLVQASDPTTAQGRVNGIVSAIQRSAPPELAIDTVTLAGTAFNRMTTESAEFTLYLGSVGPWVVAADDAAVATGIVQRANNAADTGLNGNAAFGPLHSAIPSPSQSMTFVDIGPLTELIVAAAEVSPSEAAHARFALAPFRQVIMGSSSGPDRNRSTIIIPIAIP